MPSHPTITGRGRTHLDGALRISCRLNGRRGIATCLLRQSCRDHSEDRLRAAVAIPADAMTVVEELGDRRSAASACLNLGTLDFERSALADARAAAFDARLQA